MEQRVSLITLGVPDMEKAAAFYQALGWQRADSPDGVIAFDLISQTLGLYPLAALAAEIGLPETELGTGAMTLSHNTRSKEDVAALLAAAEEAGAEVLKPAQDVFWGGHHGYFRSPDRHIWEIAFNPFSPLAGDGAFRWNGY
ncbi:VOC family protein [Leisingera thetidis]|uniref:VOC family protein n=1 Tax=Leisingera thetidis TaxID=2930199 RepID=UPI0021F6BA32|nr:VOC family protein [Leisingera thetidis]